MTGIEEICRNHERRHFPCLILLARLLNLMPAIVIMCWLVNFEAKGLLFNNKSGVLK